MQAATAVAGQADDISGVGWDFRLIEYDAEHKNTL
jgi:hypothetical protein